MKSDYRERAIRFLYSIIPYLAKNSSIYAAVEKYNCDKRRNVIFNYGSVRNVLITSDYVIKWNNNIKENYYIGTCENEKQMYDIAVKNGFGYLFAEPTMVEVYGKLYEIMPRVTPAHDSDLSDDEWYDVFSRKEKDFLCSYSIEADLHMGNFGYDKENNPVIFDYGYWRE